MMLVSSAVFSAVLAGQPKALLEDEDEDEDEQRSRVFKKKMYSARSHPLLQDVLYVPCLDANLVSAGGFTKLFNQQNKMKMSSDQFDDGDEDGVEDNQQNKMKMSSNQFDDVEYQKLEEHRGRWKVKVGKDWTEEEFEDEDEDEDNQQNKIKKALKDVYRDFDSARMFHKAIHPSIFNRVRENKSMNACFASEPSITRNIKDIIDFKLSVDQSKIIRKQGTELDIFWCIVDALAQECNHGKFSDVRRRHEDQFFALIGDTVSAANGQSISFNNSPKNNIAAMKSLGTECVNFSVTDSSLQNRAHRISSADASGRLLPEVDTGFCSPLWVLDSGGAPPPWIYDTGASFSLTGDLCIPLPPCHRPCCQRPPDHLHRPRAPSIQRLPRRQHPAHVWIYDTGASFSLTENLSLLHHRILPAHHHHFPPQVHAHWIYDTGASFSLTENLSLLHHRILLPQHRPPSAPQVHAHWIYDTGASFFLTENLSLLHRRRLRVPEFLLRHQLPPPPVWIYDTGASFSLTGDLSLLPGVCSTGDCSPFLGLRHADPVSVANGQSISSNYCGRAGGVVNLSRTAPQTTGLISSSEPIAADNSSLLTSDTTPEQTWRVASAAPQHMTGYLNHLIDYTPASGDQVIDTPNMGPLAVHGRGSVNTANITLQDVLYVPCLDANLVSTGQLAQLGYMITLGPYGCRIYKDDEDMPLVGEAHYVDGYLLELDFLRVRPSTN